jgi:hypothetical protein
MFHSVMVTSNPGQDEGREYSWQSGQDVWPPHEALGTNRIPEEGQ